VTAISIKIEESPEVLAGIVDKFHRKAGNPFR
jgi:hypothetical protein